VKDNVQLNALLTRMAQGDMAALESFYKLTHSSVYAFIFKRLRNAADAAEVLNEVMLEVWRSAGRFEGRSQVLTWVLGIANYKLLDLLRKRQEHVSEEVPLDLPDPNAVDMSVVLANAADAELVRRCLERLSDDHRMVMHLSFYEELSYQEIAEIADAPVGTIKTRMFHAKQSMRRCLGSM
jgi:RNA polymerase sigma-70 factor (ECF subfamily)